MLYNYNANGTIKGKTLWHQQTGKRATMALGVIVNRK